MLPKAILFDMDDTILIENAASEQAWRETCKVYAEKTRLFRSEELLKLIDEASEWYWSDPVKRREGSFNFYRARMTYVKKALNELGCDDERIAHEIVVNFTDLKDRLIGFLPNAEETVRDLANRGIKLALLTNGDAKVQRTKIDRFGLPKYFSICLIEGELGYGKPDPRVFQAALDRVGVTADRTWMVGDTLESDIAGAQRLKIFSIWHDYGKKGLPEDSEVKPDRIVNNISEVLSLL